jgi:alpha-tubulin suppressor-like RCC1 family protein
MLSGCQPQNTPAALVSGAAKATKVVVGWDHVVVLLANNTIVQWGGAAKQLPANLNRNIIDIAAGSRQSVALTRDKSVIVWPGPHPASNVKAPVCAVSISRSFSKVPSVLLLLCNGALSSLVQRLSCGAVHMEVAEKVIMRCGEW